MVGEAPCITRAAKPFTAAASVPDEMQQRTRNAIIERKVDLATLTQFNRTFFGTIHSFCVRLLRNHGHHLGLPTALDATENDDDLWAAFLRQLAERGNAELLDPVRRKLESLKTEINGHLSLAIAGEIHL